MLEIKIGKRAGGCKNISRKVSFRKSDVPMISVIDVSVQANDIRELKANIRERSNRVRTRKALKMVGPGGFEPPTRPL